MVSVLSFILGQISPILAPFIDGADMTTVSAIFVFVGTLLDLRFIGYVLDSIPIV